MVYQPLVYRTSGGDQLTVAEGGNVNMAAGGLLTVNGVSWITTGGYLGDQRMYFEQSSGSSGVITNYGVTVIALTTDTTGSRNYTVEPAAGRIKYIVNLTTGSTSLTVALTTGTWDGTNKNAIFSTGGVNPQAIMAVGASTTRWYTIPLTTDITFSNT